MTRKQNDYALVVGVNTYAITNPKLATQCDKYIKAIAKMDKSSWECAKAIYNIVVNDLWKEDFQTLEELGSILGLTKATISKSVKAVEFMAQNEIQEPISVGCAYLLSTLNYEEFCSYCKDMNINPFKCTKHQLEDLIATFKGRKSTDSVNDSEEKESSKKMKKGDLLTLTINDITYVIPYEDLMPFIKPYKKKEEKKEQK